MAVEIQSTITQKGTGNYFLVNAKDIDVKNGNEASSFPNTSLSTYLDELNTDVATYIKNLLVTGSLVTYTKGDGTTDSFNTTFIGTRAEYEVANAAHKIPIGTIVVITDDAEEDNSGSSGGNEEEFSTTNVLGEAVLGYCILE